MENQLAKLENALRQGRIDQATYERLKADLDAVCAPHSSDAVVSKPTSGDPNDTHSLIKRGDCHAEGCNMNAALEDFSAAIRADATCAEAFFKRGVAHGQLGNYDGDVIDQIEVIRIDPTAEPAYVELAVAYHHLGKTEQAIDTMNRFVAIASNKADALLCRADLYLDTHSYELALADCNEVIRLFPRIAIAYCRRGDIYYVQEKHQAALAEYNKALHLDPNSSYAFCRRGEIHLHNNQPQRAITEFNRAIQLDPTNAYGLFKRAHVYQALACASKSERTFALAINDFRAANRLSSEYEVPTYTLAQLNPESAVPTQSSEFDWAGLGMGLLKGAAVATVGIAYLAAKTGVGTGYEAARYNHNPCPWCGKGYRPGQSRCPHCGHDLC